jgi:hypothetical protein
MKFQTLEQREAVLKQVRHLRHVESLDQVNDHMLRCRCIVVAIAFGYNTKTQETWIDHYIVGELRNQ